MQGGETTRNSSAIPRRNNDAGPDASALEWPRHFGYTTLKEHPRSARIPDPRTGSPEAGYQMVLRMKRVRHAPVELAPDASSIIPNGVRHTRPSSPPTTSRSVAPIPDSASR